MSQTTPVIPEIERIYSILALNISEAIRLADEEDRLREAEDRLREALAKTERELIEMEQRIVAGRQDLTEAILDATNRKVPRINLWRKLVEAPWQVRSGSRIFALIVDPKADIPTEPGDLPSAVSVAIINL